MSVTANENVHGQARQQRGLSEQFFQGVHQTWAWRK